MEEVHVFVPLLFLRPGPMPYLTPSYASAHSSSRRREEGGTSLKSTYTLTLNSWQSTALLATATAGASHVKKGEKIKHASLLKVAL